MRFVLASALVLVISHPALAQSKSKAGKSGAKPAAAQLTDSTARSASDPVLRGMQWRLVGPFRGGRAVAVTGDPVEPRTFYMGTVDGGVWKTTDAGGTWHNLSDGNSTIASVGAIAVAPSDRNVIYVGTGETDFREDLTFGDGMYRSTDGGQDVEAHRARADAADLDDPGGPEGSGQRVRRRDTVTHSGRTPIAACTTRATVARRGSACSSSTTAPAPSTWRWIRRTRASSTHRCGGSSDIRGASVRAAERAGCGRARTAATRGRRSRTIRGCPTCRSGASAFR